MRTICACQDYGQADWLSLRRFYRSILGLPIKQPVERTSPFDRPVSKRAIELDQGTTQGKRWLPPSPEVLRVLFPTLGRVRSAKAVMASGNINAAGSCFLSASEDGGAKLTVQPRSAGSSLASRASSSATPSRSVCAASFRPR